MCGVSVREVSIELMVLSAPIRPHTKGLCKPAIILHYPMHDVLRIHRNFPIMICTIRRRIRVRMRAIESVCGFLSWWSPIETPICIPPEKCRVVARLLPGIGTPDVGDTFATWPINGEPIVLRIQKLKPHGCCNGGAARKVESRDDTLRLHDG